MKRYRTWIIVSIVFFVLSIVLVMYDGIHGNFIRDYMMERRTEEHLMNEGYKKEEIASIEATYNMKFNTGDINGTIAYVIFQDEPKEKYLYVQWRDSREIQQKCDYYNEDTNAVEVEYTEERKYMVKDCY
ncbi:hypothetical protein BAMA_06540 [Bacillus manliponensis]|uniref:DUF3139 domain-containing protein n=1 Tax=Bacillus manliponensis TaxID=574376 RepID=A0A073JVF9_9BACI|nr:DUF3139 domain-containing protein [Bacillus manliponensis]KEK18217.1 hypothetical protein BAMA_06540 [Bacillus manliponensis]